MTDCTGLPRPFKAALFDFDGTLVDTEGQYSGFWQATGREYRSDIPDLADRIKGTTLTDILATYFPDKALQKIITDKVTAFERQMTFPLVAGVEAFIHEIKAQGVKCAIVTASDQSKMMNVWRAMPTFLELFDLIITAEDFHLSKPSPDCYLTAARRLQVPPANCVVFEDAPNGLGAGMAAEMLTIGLATTNAAHVIAPLCHHVIDDFTQTDYSDISQRLNDLPSCPKGE